jgi:hypothetical protein
MIAWPSLHLEISLLFLRCYETGWSSSIKEKCLMTHWNWGISMVTFIRAGAIVVYSLHGTKKLVFMCPVTRWSLCLRNNLHTSALTHISGLPRKAISSLGFTVGSRPRDNRQHLSTVHSKWNSLCFRETWRWLAQAETHFIKSDLLLL